MRVFLMTLSLWLTGWSLLFADGQPEARRLMQLLRLDEVIAVMRLEGLKFGESLGRDMLPDGGGARWQAAVARLYDVERMASVVEVEFIDSLGTTDSHSLIQFFSDSVGQRIIDGELRTRRAFLDEDTENAAIRNIEPALSEQSTRMQSIDGYIGVNDLIELNVVGALNANFMFYQGLARGGLLTMTEHEIIEEVWATEEATRAETRDWLRGYLLAAYADLSPSEIDSYAELSATQSGQALNRALFASFDRMYADLSLGLGLAMAQIGRGEDL